MRLGGMITSRASITIVVTVLVILLASTAFFHFFLSPEKKGQNHSLIAIYPSVVPRHDPVNDTEQFISDLTLGKEIGFEGDCLASSKRQDCF
jgi:hypothetical protein